MKKTPILYERKELCCGCSACLAKCPRDAIAMIEDEEGFSYPLIDEKRCISCYLCVSVCPIKNSVRRKKKGNYPYGEDIV